MRKNNTAFNKAIFGRIRVSRIPNILNKNDNKEFLYAWRNDDDKDSIGTLLISKIYGTWVCKIENEDRYLSPDFLKDLGEFVEKLIKHYGD